MSSATHDLSPHSGAPSAARRWAADCLRANLGDRPAAAALVDDAVLCVSELVTNAVRAGSTDLRVELYVDPDTVRVGVLDDAAGWPVLRQDAAHDLTGRGLMLVDAVSR